MCEKFVYKHSETIELLPFFFLTSGGALRKGLGGFWVFGTVCLRVMGLILNKLRTISTEDYESRSP